MLLKNCNVVDVTEGKVIPYVAINIEGNRILSIGEEAGGEQGGCLDLKGAYVLPGLINAHVHLSIYFPYNEVTQSESPIITTMRSYKRAIDALNAGVTTIRCVNEWYQVDLKLRSMIERGWVNGE